MIFEGTITALVTPFTEKGLDLDGFRANIRDQLEGGVDGLVVLGTTGESPTLTSPERRALIEVCVSEVAGRVPVIVGTGTNCTATTVELTREASSLGADAALVITPYYNRPTQDGVISHFKAICDAVDIPLCAYDHPGRTGTSLSVETVRYLAALDNVVALKEATGSLDNLQQVVMELASIDPTFTVMTGNDELAFSAVALGASGVISVASNLVPHAMTQMINTTRGGNLSSARQQHYDLLPLFRGLCLESNPIPIKAAMNLWNIPAGPCRAPLYSMAQDRLATLRDVVSRYTHCRPELPIRS